MVESSHLVVNKSMTRISHNKITWETLQITGIQRIERVIAEFYVECGCIPSRYFRVKITEDQQGTYVGRLNISLKNADGIPDWVVGLGTSIDAALEDAIQQLIHQLDQHGQNKHHLTEANFEWADCEGF